MEKVRYKVSRKDIRKGMRMKWRKDVRISIMKNLDGKSYEAYLDGMRMHGNNEFEVINLVGLEYLSRKLPLEGHERKESIFEIKEEIIRIE